MNDRKLIIPAEVKLCATCTYWDGSRKVDGEMKVVVVSEACRGTCLYKECATAALTDVRQVHQCMWEKLDEDELSDEAPRGREASA